MPNDTKSNPDWKLFTFSGPDEFLNGRTFSVYWPDEHFRDSGPAPVNDGTKILATTYLKHKPSKSRK